MFFTQSSNLHITNNISDVCSNRTHRGNHFFRILLSRNLYPLISFHQNCKHPIKDGHRVSSSFHRKIWSQITWYECSPPVLMMSFQAWDHLLEFGGGASAEHLPSLKQDHGGFHAVSRSTKVSQKRLRLYRGWPQEIDSLWLSVHLFISHVVAFCSRRPECVVMCLWTDQWCDVCEFCMKIQATICWTVPQ